MRLFVGEPAIPARAPNPDAKSALGRRGWNRKPAQKREIVNYYQPWEYVEVVLDSGKVVRIFPDGTVL